MDGFKALVPLTSQAPLTSFTEVTDDDEETSASTSTPLSIGSIQVTPTTSWMTPESSAVNNSTKPSVHVFATSQAQIPSFLTNDLGSVTASTQISIFTLTGLLAIIYGLAFIMAFIWILWIWLRKRAMQPLKNSQFNINRDF